MTRQPNPGQEKFNRWARSYDRSVLQRLMFEPVHDAVLSASGAASAQPHDVLDVGCGTGRLLENAAGRWDSAHFTGVDASEEMVTEARGKHKGGARFVFKQGDASLLPLESDSFDVVFSTMSFHHWGDQAAGVREVARVTRPGGLFVLADVDVPFLSLLRPLLTWTDHVSFQRPEEIRRLLEQAEFSVLSHRRFWAVVRTQLFVARKQAHNLRPSH
jgi:ubiquinone/menaquinone biosynthesis C-methylase UbiE